MTFLVRPNHLPGRALPESRARARVRVSGPSNGGLIPELAHRSLLIVVSGVVFAYAAVELVGTAAGETEEPEKHHTVGDQSGSSRASRSSTSVRSRLPSAAACPSPHMGGESPFVTVDGSWRVDWRPDNMVARPDFLEPECRTPPTGCIVLLMGESWERPGVPRPHVEVRRPGHGPHPADRRAHLVRCGAQRALVGRGLLDWSRHGRSWGIIAAWAGSCFLRSSCTAVNAGLMERRKLPDAVIAAEPGGAYRCCSC